MTPMDLCDLRDLLQMEYNTAKARVAPAPLGLMDDDEFLARQSSSKPGATAGNPQVVPDTGDTAEDPHVIS
ncbi:hypothetical protein ABZX51_006643 [Aspergillus tubingensis]